jgi:nicotinate-nucleotide adenylyltransferase
VVRVGLFGGSFNPPHVGHLLVTAYVLATAEVDEVWLMPAHRHAFGKALAPFHHRVELCSLLASFFRKGVRATSVESEVEGAGYTVDTLEHLHRRYPTHAFRLIIGTDILAETHAWKEFDRVEALAPPLVVARSGHPHPRGAGLPEMPAVSSTAIRAALAAGEDVSGWVPREVLAYVHAAGLYAAPASCPD